MLEKILGVVVGLTFSAGTFTLAQAADLGPNFATPLSAASTNFVGCDTSLDNINNLYSAYYAPLERYEVRTLAVDSVPPACQGGAYRVNIVDATASGAVLPDGVLTGVLSGSNNILSFTSGAGPEIEGLNNANDSANVVVVIRGP